MVVEVWGINGSNNRIQTPETEGSNQYELEAIPHEPQQLAQYNHYCCNGDRRFGNVAVPKRIRSHRNRQEQL
ncbi:MAG: hypothetical protein ABSD44_07365, partial [Terracidiphilus sp.]